MWSISTPTPARCHRPARARLARRSARPSRRTHQRRRRHHRGPHDRLTRALRQLSTNLAHNAIVHNLPEQGTVWVTTSIQPEGVVLTVENTGEKLTPQLVAALAEPFVRGTERIRTDHAGAGLGLAIVKSNPSTRRNPHPHPPGRRRPPRHGATTRRTTPHRPGTERQPARHESAPARRDGWILDGAQRSQPWCAATDTKRPDNSASQPTSGADHRRLRADPRRGWARRRRGSRGPPARPRSLATCRAGPAPRPIL